MTYTAVGVQEFLATNEPFNSLSPQIREQLGQKVQPLRYRMGQAIVVRETMPREIVILYSGQARLLGYPPGAKSPTTLALLQPGSILGWISTVREIACESAIASSETICLTLSIPDFRELLNQHPQLKDTFSNQCHLVEVFDLLGLEMQRQARGGTNLKDLAISSHKEATILNLLAGKTPLDSLDPNRVWLVSSGVTNFEIGDRLLPTAERDYIKVSGSSNARLIGLRSHNITDTTTTTAIIFPETDTPAIEISYAPERPIPNATDTRTSKATKYPFVGGSGHVDATLAVFQMLAQHLEMPFRRDVLRRALTNSYERTGGISLQLCGAVAELMSLKSQLIEVPAIAVSRIPTPAMLLCQDTFALLYSANESEIVLVIPEIGIRRMKPSAFIEAWGESGQVLLLQQTSDTPTRRFGISWFVPSIIRYRKVLIEVLIASFFVQLFGLANPLMTQVIIDKVLVQNSIDTLNVLGIFLVVIAIFEAVITSIRTKSQTQNTTDLSRQQWLNFIGTNEQSIAEIDSQLTKAMVENNKRLWEIDSQISTAQLQLRYEQITAPSDGTIFDMQAHNPGFVTNASQPILKIVPNDAMTAKVFITNRDIGFVKQGMDVDVRIDSFPFSEFGDVKDKLMWIGDDALPPDKIYPFYRFPAKVKLQNQFLLINGRKVPLQSGMSVNANIKVRSRTVMSIFTDLFSKSVESLKTVR